MAKILLVEDDNNLREIYEARLQAEGYTIVSAMDGEEALVLAKKEKPDLVISDVMMPRISGFEMLDILRNTEGLKEVKVIMLTALGQAEDKTRADSLGADRYLVKSQVTLEDIVRAAQELLGPADTTAAPAVATTPAPANPAPANEPTMPPAASTPPAATPAPAVTATPQVVPVTPAPAASPTVQPAVPTPAPAPTNTPIPVSQPTDTTTPTPPAQEPPAGIPTPTNPPAPPAATPPAPEPTAPPATQQDSAVPTAEPVIPSATAPAASPAVPTQEPVVQPPAPSTPPQPETPAPAPAPDIASQPAPAVAPEPATAPTEQPTPPESPTPPQAEHPDTPESLPTPDTGQPSQAQSASAEEAAIKAQIENFVSQNSQTAPKAEALDEAMMANAIKGLTSNDNPSPTINANPKPKIISPVAPAKPTNAEPQPSGAPATYNPTRKDDDGVSIAHKKVIQPINDTAPTAPDLNELLAKEGISSLDDAPTPQPNQSYGVSPAPTAPAPAPAPTPSGAPSYSTPHPPGHVISPNNNPSGVDPNSIAL